MQNYITNYDCIALMSKGLPIAIPASPTSIFDEFPNTSGLREDNSCR
jgi:hypothetical protein